MQYQLMMGHLQKWDEWLFRFINHTLSNPVADWILPLLNHLAPYIPLLIFGLACLAYTQSKRLWILALIIMMGVILGDTLVFNPLKQWVARARPAASLDGIRVLATGATGGYSFPSSHTSNAFVIAAILCHFFPQNRIIILVAASFIGFARIYVGVHYPSDILGSSILGWLFGKGYFYTARYLWRTWSLRFKSNFKLKMRWAPWLVLASIQIARLLWAATTDLDVPPDMAALWCHTLIDTASNVSTDFGDVIRNSTASWFGKFWFGMMGSSPIALWLIPWMLQSIWLSTLGWIAQWYRGKEGVWGIVLLNFFIPLISQLSFLGSPIQILEDSDWAISKSLQAFLWYSILGLPLWASALIQLRSHFMASLFTLLGLAAGSIFPQLPWWIPILMASGTILSMAEYFAENLYSIAKPEFRWLRFLFTIFLAYGLTIATAVYNPRFLRKLDISFLPRNSPHYIQTGWREWIHHIHPHLVASSCKEIWTDSLIARNQIQYLLGKSFRVIYLDKTPANNAVPLTGIFYIREIYLAQIHPDVIFTPRRDKNFPFPRQNMNELSGIDIFHKGDPIREFQLYLIPHQSAK